MALPEESETLTIRLPKGLKGLVEQTARLRSTTVTAVVRESLQNAFMPVALVQTPGLTKSFQEFIEENNRLGRPTVLILVKDLKGNRYCFEGQINNNMTNPSVVTIASRSSDTEWVVPRHEVVGWFGGGNVEIAMLQKMAMTLQQNGWAFR